MTRPRRRQTAPRARRPSRALVAILVLAASDCGPVADPVREVRPGIEVLSTDSVAVVRGLRVGLITNHTGRSRNGEPSARVLLEAGVDVRALFSPEHGIAGRSAPGETVRDTIEPITGLPAYSLYGERRSPAPQALEGLDALVFDIQDIGARYYTYMSTMAEAMVAAEQAGILFVVADRPNPIGGDLVQGNVLDTAFASFVGPYPVPMRHGMTVGELALMFNDAFGIGADLRVIPASGWRRAEWADRTGIPWVPPSPNMPALASAWHYPGICLLEGTDLSVGRGTDRPFQQIGAPWLDAGELLSRLAVIDLPGVRFEPVSFVPSDPDDGKYDGELVRGVRLRMTDRTTYDPTVAAVALLVEIRRIGGRSWRWRPDEFDRLAGTDRLRHAIEAGQSAEEIVATWTRSMREFEVLRAGYLIYP